MENHFDVLIVDDEEAQRIQLAERLQMHFPQLNIVGLCASSEEAVLAVSRYAPQLIFLDVEMPGMNGFEFLESLKNIRFSVIFTTSHSTYAVMAFRVAAIDFLLKPFLDEDLISAVDRFFAQQYRSQQERIDVLLKNLHEKTEAKIALPTATGYFFIRIQDVIRLESQNNYTTFFMKDKNQHVVSRIMKDCEEMLADFGFTRVHQSHLINLSYVRKFTRGEGGTIEMEDGSVVEVSRRKKEEFIEALRRL
jgi:two-component system, LytTR family, response regulator